MTKEAGIGVGGFFMIGTPGDTYEIFQKTYRFAEQDLFDEVRFYNTEPYPGTQLYEWIRNNGRFIAEPQVYLNSHSRWEEEPIFETADFPQDLRRKAFNEGEFLVVKKMINKIVGKKIGFLFCIPCKIKLIRKIVLHLGFKVAPLILQYLDTKKRV
jgi:hypothetical protein